MGSITHFSPSLQLGSHTDAVQLRTVIVLHYSFLKKRKKQYDCQRRKINGRQCNYEK